MINQKHWQTSPSSESGFTIIESLVAILIASILLTAIAPVIVLSVATRVQARRIETATDAAKGYIDGVRSGIINAPSNPITGPISSTNSLNAYAVPTEGSLNCSTANDYCSSPATNLYCFSVDGSGCTTTSSKNFVIQAFRYNQDSTDADRGYYLGVRVYRADGFANDGVLKKADANTGDKQQTTFTGGLGNRKAPLVEMTTEITKGVEFKNFCDRLQQTNPQSNCS